MIKQNVLAVISIVILLINYGKSTRNYLLNLSWLGVDGYHNTKKRIHRKQGEVIGMFGIDWRLFAFTLTKGSKVYVIGNHLPLYFHCPHNYFFGAFSDYMVWITVVNA